MDNERLFWIILGIAAWLLIGYFMGAFI